MSYACIGLYNPKTPANIGGVLRAAYAFDAGAVFVSGLRYRKHGADTCGGYAHLPLVQTDDLLSVIPYSCVPIAVGDVLEPRSFTRRAARKLAEAFDHSMSVNKDRS